MNIVPYDARYESELIAMWRAAFEHGVGITDPNPIAAQTQYFRDVVLRENTVRMVLDGDTLVAFLASTPTTVAQLYVRVGHHRRGIGSQLLELAKQESAGTLTLFTFDSNRVAQAFYEKHGFVLAERGFEHDWQLEDIRYEWRRP